MVNHKDQERIEAVFQAAADLAPPEREAYLARTCAREPEVERRVRAMLRRMEAGESLPPAAPGLPGTDGEHPDAAPAESPGTLIGRYKLQQQIGEGGYGVVYMAEQTDPVRRQVALKVIKLGMDTREVVARFEAERQALAMMDHPHIARVLDGGSTESGRPYFVMELVRGVSITKYCDENKLSTQARLELFTSVCQAVHHAHQKGVIHRDIKPSNVMVTLADGVPIPKVIDFGIAKAIHTRLTEKTLFTEYQRFIGTPAYMSPEQAEMSALDIDTRTDIYSLGVLLYELLTGSTPFDTTKLLEIGLAEIQRVLREEEPERPSQRISTSADATIAACRGLELGPLSRRLRGELDWIVLKALEKDRTRRYGSASELADDVVRHLDDDPVLASPPTAAYRIQKFLSKNRAAVGWLTLLFLALCGGIVGTSVGMLEAGAQRDGARREAEHAETVTDFLVQVLSLTDPEIAGRPDLSVRVLLDRASQRVKTVLADNERAEARVHITIGRAYASLGEMRSAELHLRRGTLLADALDGYDRSELYTALWSLTHVLFYLERHDALTTAHWARRVAHAHIAERFPEVSRTLDRYLAAVDEGAHINDPGPIEATRPLFEESVRITHARVPEGDPLWPIIAGSYLHAAFNLWYSPHEEHSLAYWEEALAIQRRELQEGSPTTALTLSQMTSVLNRLGELEVAEGHIRESIESTLAGFPPENLLIVNARAMLGENLTLQERFAEAEEHLLFSHQSFLTGTDKLTFYLADSFSRMIALHAGWGHAATATQYRDELTLRLNSAELRQPWPIQRTIYGPEHAELLRLCDALNAACGSITYPVAIGSLSGDEFLPLIEQLIAERRRTLPDEHPLAIETARTLLHWSHELHPVREAHALEAVLQEALSNLGPLAAQAPADLAEARAGAARRAWHSGREREARELARNALELIAPIESDAWFVAAAKVRIARTLLLLELFGEAEALLLPARAIFEQQLWETHSKIATVKELCFQLYTSWGKPEEARRFLPSPPTATPRTGTSR